MVLSRFVAHFSALLKSDGKLITAGLVLAFAIFASDLYVRLGVAAGVPYIGLVLICLWAKHPSCIYLMATIGTVLTIAGYLFSPEGGLQWVVLTNRGLAIFAIWAVALFSAKRLHEAIRRKTAEANFLAAAGSLSDSEARLQLILNSVPVGISYIDAEQRFRFANDRYKTILNKPPETLLGMTLKEVIGEEAYGRAKKHVETALTGEPVTFENKLSNAGAGVMAISVSYVPHRRQDGTVDGCFAVVYDITKRKESEDALRVTAEELDRRVLEQTADLSETRESLRESEERFAQVFRQGPLGIAITGLDYEIMAVNESFCRMLEYSEEELIGRSFMDITHPDDIDQGIEIQTAAFKGETDNYRFEKRYITKTGNTVWANLTSSVVKDSEGKPRYNIGTVEDITERKLDQELLQKNERSLRHTQELAKIGNWDWDIATGKKRWSEELYRIFGVENDGSELDQDSYMDRIHPDDAEMVQRLVTNCLETRENVKFDYRIILPDGNVRNLRAICSLTMDEAGNPISMTGATQDITEQKKIEEQLHQAQKMDAVGQLTGGVAHEFNNLLMVIIGNIEALESGLGKDDPLQSFTSTAMRGALRGAELTQSLLAFSRKQRLEAGETDLGELVSGMQSLFQRTLGETILIETDLAEGLWSTSADTGQIEAALLNFVLNARDAMPDGGTITLRTSNRVMTADTAAHYDCVGPGDYVTLEVSDSGTGMTDEQIEHAFEPFYTTKEVGKGTGLGLSVAYGFAKQSGGCLEIESEPGQGTIVRLSLPRAVEKKTGTEVERSTAEPASGSGKILVVEDDADVRALAVSQLSDLGYQIIEAEDGPAALTLLDEHPDVDLLFSDVVLPGGMSGPEAAKQAHQEHAHLKVLFTSGYPEKDIEDMTVNGKDVAILRKPYLKPELAEAIAAAMKSG